MITLNLAFTFVFRIYPMIEMIGFYSQFHMDWMSVITPAEHQYVPPLQLKSAIDFPGINFIYFP